MEINQQVPFRLAFNASAALEEQRLSQSKLSSGKKIIDSASDSGAYSQSMSLENEMNRKEHTINNLQNLVSFSQSQLDGLQQAGKVLLRMNELAKLSLDITKQDTDRSNYDHEFKELAFVLDSINQKKFNGLDLFFRRSFF